MGDDRIDLERASTGVIHFAEDGMETVDAWVGETSLDFVADSFSVYMPYAANASVAPRAAGTHTFDSSMLVTNAANDWQIVDEGYKGNGMDNKIPSLADTTVDTRVRVQKNVIPTDEENVFRVYLSIDNNEIFKWALSKGGICARSNNDSGELWSVVSIKGRDVPFDIYEKSQTNGARHAQFKIVDRNGNLMSDGLVDVYWDGPQNITFLLPFGNGSQAYMLSTSMRDGSTNGVLCLPDSSDSSFWDKVLGLVDLGSVKDTMGEYIKFKGVLGGDYVNWSEENGVLTWVPSPNPNFEYESISADNKTKTVWFTNIAQLVYEVELDVTAPGFKTCIDQLDASLEEREAAPDTYGVKVNDSAILTYGNGQTQDFPVPYVRGLLYDVHFDKLSKETDSDGEHKKLAGAEFTLTPSEGGYADVTPITGTSDSEGRVCFKGVPWGTYTLTETKAPEGGYKLPEASIREGITVCYTHNEDELAARDAVDDNGNPIPYQCNGSWLWNGFVAKADEKTSKDYDSNVVYNELNGYDLTLEKVTPSQNDYRGIPGSNGTVAVDNEKVTWHYLSGAQFDLYVWDTVQVEETETEDWVQVNESTTLNPTEHGSGAIVEQKGLEPGKVYKLVETKAPNGYNQLAEPVYFKSEDGKEIKLLTPDGNGGYTETTPNHTANSALDGETLKLIIANYGGYVLPSTGGIGTYWYTLGGFTLMLACALALVYTHTRRKARARA